MICTEIIYNTGLQKEICGKKINKVGFRFTYFGYYVPSCEDHRLTEGEFNDRNSR